MKKVLLATTAVAAFVAFSGTAQAQDPGRPDFGATEGGGGAGSAFTVKTSGAVKFYLKYATTGLEGDNVTNDGLFTLITSELEINGAATTDNGTDIATHVDFDFSGVSTDSAETVTIGGGEDSINVGNIVRIQELSVKIGGGWGSVELGTNDGAEDTFKIYGASVAAGTGGFDGDHHAVTGGVSYAGTGGQAGSGDSGDALKATYLSPVFAGVQLGASLAYSTEGPNDTNGGDLGVGVGAKYSGSGGGLDYAISVVWGDTTILVGGDKQRDEADKEANDDGFGGLGVGFKLGGAGASFATGVTIDGLGRGDKYALTDVDTGDPLPTAEDHGLDINWSGGVAYAIPGGKANVSLSAALAVPFSVDSEGKFGNVIEQYVVFLSADYAVLPGVTLAVDLGYGDSNLSGATVLSVAADGSTTFISNADTNSAGFTGLLRVKAAF